MVYPLEATRHPAAVELEIPLAAQAGAEVEHELRTRAGSDWDKCCGYFPALTGVEGILSDLPACRAFAAGLPRLTHAGIDYRFNFLISRSRLGEGGGNGSIFT